MLFEEKINFYVQVILPLALPANYFTYALPNEYDNKIQVGQRVEVEIKNKKYAGIIRNITTQKPDYITKPILNILDDTVIINTQQLKLWEWMANYYCCSEGEIMQAALPAHLKLNSESLLIFNEDYEGDFNNLTDNEYLLAEALSMKKELRIKEVQQILDAKKVYPIVKSIADKQICFIWENLDNKFKVKKEKYVYLNNIYKNEEKLAGLFDEFKRAEMQMHLLLAFLHLQKTEGTVTQKALLEKAKSSSEKLQGLVKKGILIVEEKTISRFPNLPLVLNVDINLNTEQAIALDKIKTYFETPDKNIFLLHGITGSGKTAVYIHLIEQYIKQNKQVLYLLPEIALTSQMIDRLQKHFGGYIAIYHSKFNDNERVELWQKVLEQKVNLIIGARSSLLLPFKDLGLIIIDEEHDASFKQEDPAPRYNARDTAIYYSQLFNAKVLLGTATPAVETFFNVQQKRFGYFYLKERFGNIPLPEVEILDNKQVATKEKVLLHPLLHQQILDETAKGKQVILFQNRRGYNPYILCKSCGYIPQCIHCDVNLTWHKMSNKLHCHYCGSHYPKINTCPRCGSGEWIDRNFGTEKVEEYLEQQFPHLKIGRMDVDSVRGKNAHSQLITAFEKQKIDILVGTQMVVKGLDFENVSLVGILDADSILSFADFRVMERGFQIMEQVSGRAGRKKEQGKVMIQAINNKHIVLSMVKAHDYFSMYDNEIKARYDFFYPPFSRLVKIIIKHKKQATVIEAAHELTNLLQQDFSNQIKGPAAPVIEKLRDHYIQEILIKLKKEVGSMAKTRKLFYMHIHTIQNINKYKGIYLTINVDPMS